MSATKDQAQQASAQIDLCNSAMNILSSQLATAQGNLATIQAYDPAKALQLANNTLAAINASIGLTQVQLQEAAAVVNDYNTANPSDLVPLG